MYDREDKLTVAVIFLSVFLFIASMVILARPVVWTPTVPEGYKTVQDDSDKTLVIPNEYYFRWKDGEMVLVKE